MIRRTAQGRVMRLRSKCKAGDAVCNPEGGGALLTLMVANVLVWGESAQPVVQLYHSFLSVCLRRPITLM